MLLLRPLKVVARKDFVAFAFVSEAVSACSAARSSTASFFAASWSSHSGLKKTHINKYLRKRYTKRGRRVQTVRASKLFLKYAHLALSGAASLSCASLCTRSTLLLSQSCACAKPYRPLHQHTVARSERLRAQHQRLVAKYDSRAVRQWGVWRSRVGGCRAIGVVEPLERPYARIAD